MQPDGNGTTNTMDFLAYFLLYARHSDKQDRGWLGQDMVPQ